MIKQGDTIGIIALSGACEQEKVELAQANIEKLGYKIKLSKNVYDKNMYLAGSDDDKLANLYDFFEDDNIKLILNARGGFGAIHLINKINYEIVRQNPKPFCGFSDVTALLLMFYKKANLITYHGPMAISDYADDFSLDNFQKMIAVINGVEQELIAKKVYKSGNASGKIWGGNLSTVVSLCGQDFIPDEDFIFFTEDLNENVYKIDKMFSQLFNIEQFKDKCKGIILGDFLNVDRQDWLEKFFSSLPVITLSGFEITHNLKKETIPIGKSCYIENEKLIIRNL